jgi:methylglutaconyl-CoA hydratase
MSSFIRRSIEHHVATVTLNRPDLHNAFNDEVMREITDAFGELGESPDVRAIILAGEGKSFCAGADVHWMKRMVDYTFDENVADARVLSRMLLAIRNCSKPVIARIHGAALGGGVGLTAACDIAVAVKSAMFSLSEVKLGIIPAVISPFVIEKIGMGHMRRYGLTAERFDALEAKRIGLISETVDTAEAMDAWIANMVNTIKESAPGAIAVCKQVLREVQGLDWARVEALTTRRIAERRVSAEGQEGLKAFLDKRKPNWITE